MTEVTTALKSLNSFLEKRGIGSGNVGLARPRTRPHAEPSVGVGATQFPDLSKMMDLVAVNSSNSSAFGRKNPQRIDVETTAEIPDEEDTTEKVSVVKNIPTKPGWELIPSGDGGFGKYRISDPDIREFIFQEFNTSLIEPEWVADPADSEHIARLKNRMAEISLDLTHRHMLAGNFKYDSEDLEEYPLLESTFEGFISFVKESHKVIADQAQAAFDAGSVTFVQLQIVLDKENTNYAMKEDGHFCGFISKGAKIVEGMFGTNMHIAGHVYISDGERIGVVGKQFKIPAYGGSLDLDNLGIVSLEGNSSEIKKLVTRGKQYIHIVSNPGYLAYKGVITSRNEYRPPVRHNATGRVVVDRSGMGRFLPNYDMYYGGDNIFHQNNSFAHDSKLLTDKIAMLLPPVVYGFSFISKTWGELNLEALGPIDFRKNAFDQLQLPLATKHLLSALVENTSGEEDADIIAGKGGGCNILLAGNPGVGKTLTAETMAERLERPLYMVNVGELGTDVESLETNLKRILDTATRWKALLLVDEADIFLEERNDQDIERNAMVAIFLRLLEYYQGILFLTTNRAKKIDPAFYSRIHMALHYDALTETDRLNIWSNLMARNGIKDINPVPLSKLLLNGRQIKNTIANAKAFAKYNKRDVTDVDFKVVVDSIVAFEEVLKEDTLDHITVH